MRAIFVAILVNLMLFSSSSYARNDVHDYPIKQALDSEAALGKLNHVQLFSASRNMAK
jgi:hypothetical protein